MSESYQDVNGRALSLIVKNVGSSAAGKEFIISKKDKDNPSFYSDNRVPCAVFISIIALYFNFVYLSCFTFIFILLGVLKLYGKASLEKVLILPSVGIQATTQYFFGNTDVIFIPWSHIDDVIINEVIKSQRIIYFLTVVVLEDEKSPNSKKLVLLFKEFKPRLACLKLIYCEVQEFLKMRQ